MINPVDLRHKKFKKSLRGYDTEEVHTFLNLLADELKSIILEKETYKQELGEAKAKLEQYKETEDILRRTLMQAEESSKKKIENAEEKARLIIAEAEQKAKQMLEQAKKEKAETELHLQELKIQEKQLLEHLKMFLSSQLSQISQYLEGQYGIMDSVKNELLKTKEHPSSNKEKKETPVTLKQTLENKSFFEKALKKETPEINIAEEISKEL